MNPVLVDPDIKINMSLDEIIYLTRDDINRQLSWRGAKTFRKWRRSRRMRPGDGEHSVPLVSTAGGVGIHVSKNSCLLGVENRRRITDAFANRAINSSLIEKSKEIIPAEYKLIRTCHGVERILVPTEQYYSKPHRKKLVPPRKLNKENSGSSDNSLLDKPPPLISSMIYDPPEKESIKMDVDSDNEITILEHPEPGKLCEVIDLESDLPVDVLEAKELCLRSTTLNGGSKALSDRFTFLTGRFQF